MHSCKACRSRICHLLRSSDLLCRITSCTQRLILILHWTFYNLDFDTVQIWLNSIKKPSWFSQLAPVWVSFSTTSVHGCPRTAKPRMLTFRLLQTDSATRPFFEGKWYLSASLFATGIVLAQSFSNQPISVPFDIYWACLSSHIPC